MNGNKLTTPVEAVPERTRFDHIDELAYRATVVAGEYCDDLTPEERVLFWNLLSDNCTDTIEQIGDEMRGGETNESE